MMTVTGRMVLAAVAAAWALAGTADAAARRRQARERIADLATPVKLTGNLGRTFERMLRNHVEATDPVYLASPFKTRTERRQWQTEFWGKYMHAAVPLSAYSNDPTLVGRIAAGAEALMATQDAEGYIGNYSPEARFGKKVWDVWGVKYTMLGLLHFVESEKPRGKSEELSERGQKALRSCCRLCDYLVSKVGPGAKTTIAETVCRTWFDVQGDMLEALR